MVDGIHLIKFFFEDNRNESLFTCKICNSTVGTKEGFQSAAVVWFEELSVQEPRRPGNLPQNSRIQLVFGLELEFYEYENGPVNAPESSSVLMFISPVLILQS